MNKSYVFWLTGISGAGKTTLAKLLKAKLESKSLPVMMIDGDEVREFFENDLGYSPQDRIINVRRIAFAAKLVSETGTNAVVANIAPYKELREFIRRKTPNYIEIFVKASTQTTMERDVKGHYKKFKDGQMTNLVGVDDRYDIPTNPHITVDTENESIEESLQKIWSYIEKNNLF
jgi:adenylyl-sulfate kinase